MAWHEMKCWPSFFAALADGRKRHEVRKWDRDYAVGDALLIEEYEPDTALAEYAGTHYSGRRIDARVTFLSTIGAPDDGMAVMSIEVVKRYVFCERCGSNETPFAKIDEEPIYCIGCGELIWGDALKYPASGGT